ncbi:MAG TPA: hypothetical protein VHX88_10100 [Solirubrobacteraceae bacterium]|nr:hypothetical protein [Solirubrobacteraceae bacterium]
MTRLASEMNVVLGALAPVQAPEREVARAEHLFHRHREPGTESPPPDAGHAPGGQG